MSFNGLNVVFCMHVSYGDDIKNAGTGEIMLDGLFVLLEAYLSRFFTETLTA